MAIYPRPYLSTPRTEPPSPPEVKAVPTFNWRRESGQTALSFAQERLWFIDQINSGEVSANLSHAVCIKGSLDIQALTQALRYLVARHQLLRTTFARNEHHARTDGKPVQLIADTGSVELRVIDLSREPESHRRDSARAFVCEEARRSFDLALGPLLRLNLLELEETDHILLLSTHRIIFDEASIEIFLTELWACYRAILVGEMLSFRESDTQFADYAGWQREAVTDEVLAAEVEHWRTILEGAPSLLELPLDHPRPALNGSHGNSVIIEINERLIEELRSFSNREDTTLFNTALTTFQVLLARYARQDDIVVAASTVNRRPSELENLVGPLDSPLVVRAKLGDNPSFRDLLRRTAAAMTESQAHQSVPFERLIEELNVERSLSHTPVFQVRFNFHEPATEKLSVPGLVLETFDFEVGIARLDLEVDFLDEGDRVRCRFTYNTDLFDRTTIERMSRNFKILLTAIVNNPNQHVYELPLLDETERRLVLSEWNPAAGSGAVAGCLHELFRDCAERMADRCAVACGDSRLTYRQLDARANQLAHYLRKHGIGPESLVGVCLERSTDLIVALLAILKAGAAYVPLDVAYPADRLSFMLTDSNVSLLISNKRVAETLPQKPSTVIRLDEEWSKIANQPDTSPEEKAVPENLAYVIYTSGSTGRPKGVAVTHQTVAHVLEAMNRRLNLREGDVWTAVHSSAFDFFEWEVWGCLLHGGELIIVPTDVLQSPSELLNLIRRQKVTILSQTPAALRQLLAARTALVQPNGDWTLRHIISGGDALDHELARELIQLQIPSWNFYGPTETTIWATCTQVTGNHEELTSIGHPISGVEIYLLNQQLQPVPIGVPGELFIGGAALARGYLDRPDLTAESFLPNPFSTQPNARLYRTGDLARFRQDGKIDFLGRLDHQVKVSGFRIELGEIEAVLNQFPTVERAVVTVREDQKHDQRLVAYLVSKADKVNTGELRTHLQGILPSYMIPTTFVFVEEIPLTVNGKVNRKALPVPSDSRPDISQAFVAARDEIEEQLVQLWKKVLGLKSVGVCDNFFELGGHSLLAARLFAQIENIFGRNLPLATLFQAPTIEQLAALLKQSKKQNSWTSLVAIQPNGSKPPLFCVHAAGANVLIYRPLSRHLGNDQPVYALQAQGLDGRTPPYDKVEDMAAHYIRELREVQPNGPYYLLGASFGGLVAFEIAHQLIAQGEKIALLAMLNTDCPFHSLSHRLKCHYGHLRQNGSRRYVLSVASALVGRISPRVEAQLEAATANQELKAALENQPDKSDPLIRTVLANLEAERRYHPTKRMYPGKITYFFARDAESGFDDNRVAWRKIASGGFQLHVSPGNHGTMREEPNIAVLVQQLKVSLTSAQA